MEPGGPIGRWEGRKAQPGLKSGDWQRGVAAPVAALHALTLPPVLP